MKSHKYTYISLLMILLFPLNYNGKTIRLKNDFNSPSISTSNEESAAISHESTQAATPSSLAIAEDESPLDKSTATLFAAFSTISAILITILCSIILGYLQSVKAVQQCLLSYLYQDAGKIYLCLQWSLFVTANTGNWYAGNKEMILEQSITIKLLCFFVVVLYLQLLITVNIMCAIQIFMKKELTLDPPLPFGHDETAIIKMIRLTIIIFILLMSVMYGLDEYPLFYYRLTGGHTTLSKLPFSTQLLAGMIITLTLSVLVASLVNKFYRRTNDVLGTGEDQSTRMLNPSVMFAVLMPITFIGFISIIFGVSVSAATLIGQILHGVLFPGYLILYTAQLKNYAKKTMSNMITKFQRKIEDMNLHALHFFRLFNTNSNQVQPIA